MHEFYFDGTPPSTHQMKHYVDAPTVIGDWIAHDRCDGTFDRVWSAPHMGGMSSGEPPR